MRTTSVNRLRLGARGRTSQLVGEALISENTGLVVSGLTVETGGRQILRNIDLTVPSGSCVALVGPSGSGKTTLLNTLAGIVPPKTGSILLGLVDIGALPRIAAAKVRLHDIGMVFQFGELLPELSLLENVALPSRMLGLPSREADLRASNWLGVVGLSGKCNDYPLTVSGGEVQRTGIARALAHEPKLVLADEPTGMLDRDNSLAIMDLLVGTAKNIGAAVVVSTHDTAIARRADCSFLLQGSSLVLSSNEVGR